jgi:putative membrane protein (TIGR04086 family)
MMSGFFIAKNSNRNGYVNGLIIGAINIVLLLLLSLILGETPKLSIGIYFLILLLSSTIGGMFGINFSRKS